MKDLTQLHLKLTQSPSLLSVGDEIFFMKSLMNLSSREIVEEQPLFFDILEQLEASHTVGLGYLDDNSENREQFKSFSNFLDTLAGYMPSQSAWLRSAADTFRIEDS